MPRLAESLLVVGLVASLVGTLPAASAQNLTTFHVALSPARLVEPEEAGRIAPGSAPRWHVDAQVEAPMGSACLRDIIAEFVAEPATPDVHVSLDPARVRMGAVPQPAAVAPPGLILGWQARFTIGAIASLDPDVAAFERRGFEVRARAAPEPSLLPCMVGEGRGHVAASFQVGYRAGFQAEVASAWSNGPGAVDVTIVNRANGASDFRLDFGRGESPWEEAGRTLRGVAAGATRSLLIERWEFPDDWDRRIRILQTPGNPPGTSDDNAVQEFVVDGALPEGPRTLPAGESTPSAGALVAGLAFVAAFGAARRGRIGDGRS